MLVSTATPLRKAATLELPPKMAGDVAQILAPQQRLGMRSLAERWLAP